MEKRRKTQKSNNKTKALNLMSALIFKEDFLEATFLSRLNRFIILVQMNSETLPSFVPDPGRMQELLKHGTKVFLREKRQKNSL